MSVVLLEQLLGEFNKEETLIKLETYNCVHPTTVIEIGVLDSISGTSLVKVNGSQTKEMSYKDVLEQGASKIIDYIFKQGISLINKENNEERTKGSTTLCVNNK